ncbi:hypothetical protein NC651_037151 [Populus alba x Populus x berolinensis]|nr:hypothetical protein NC651_037151 [Populus alba x Populus x berolinensis]
MNSLTASEVAGYAVGALLLCATISAPKIDSFISASQRRPSCIPERWGTLSSPFENQDYNLVKVQYNVYKCYKNVPHEFGGDLNHIGQCSLGMCKRCGDLRMIACSGCKGTGLVKEGGALSFNFIDDMYESLGGDSKVKTIRCSKCQARGRFCCPDCSKAQSV